MSRFPRGFSVVAYLATGAASLLAQDTWLGTTSSLWDTGTNWSLNLKPGTGDDAIFPTPVPSSGGTITLTPGEVANSLNFQDAYTLTGGDLTLTTGTVTVAPTFTAIIASNLLGTAPLTKLGSGTLTLSADNTQFGGFTGKTVISAGTLSISADNNLGTVPGATVADQITLGGGGLKFTAVTTLSGTRGITVSAGNSFFDVNGLGTTTTPLLINGVLAGGGATSTLTFTNTSATAGVINLSANGTLATGTSVTIDSLTTVSLGNVGAAGALSTNAINVNTNGTTAILRFNRNAASTFAGVVSGSGQVSLASNTGNVVDLTAASGNTYTGGTNLAGTSATVRAATDTAFGTGSINAVGGTVASTNATAHTFANNFVITGTTTFGQSTGGTGALTLNGDFDFGAGSRTLNASVPTTINGVISNGTGFTKSSAGALTLTNANTVTGTTVIGTGTLVIAGPNGSLLGITTIGVGDNNGRDETFTLGSTADVVTTAGGLNRIADTATLSLRQGAGVIFNGPAAGSTGFAETFGPLENQTGFNVLTLNAAAGLDAQLNASSFSRTNNAVLLVRGGNLGAVAGTADSTRLIFTNSTGLALVGGGTGAGTLTQSIAPALIGDNTGATGAGNSFITYDATSGVRPLATAEYDTTVAGIGSTRNVTTAGETVVAAAQVNALRVTGGTLIANAAVRVGSGAVLSTANSTIAGTGSLEFGTVQGVVSTAANTTAITNAVNVSLAGAGGLVLSSSGSANNITALGGNNNRLIGGVTINSGIVRVDNASALNSAIPQIVTLRTNGPGGTTTLRLNGNSVAVRDLNSGTLAAGTITTIENNSSVATAVTLTDYQQTAQLFTASIGNGTTGTLAFVKSGPAVLTAQGVNTYSGGTIVRGGTLLLSGSGVGRLTGAGAITISDGAILRLTNNSSNSNTDRIPTQPVNLRAGTLDYDNDASAAVFTETTGALNLLAGANVVTVDKGNSTTNVSNLTFASLARSAGSTVNFTSQSNNTAIYDLGTTAQSRLIFTAAPTLDDGIIGGYATIDSSATNREFATYVSAGTISVTALPAAGYTTTLSSGVNAAQNVKITATPAALNAATRINSLNLQQVSATTVDLGTNTLRVESGGILATGNFDTTITGGTGSGLFAGNGDNTAGDLVVHAYNGTIASLAIAANAAADTLTKSGVVNGSPIVFSGTAPTGLAIGVTYFAVNATPTTFQVANTVGGIPINITADSSTAAFTETTLLSINTPITDNGTGSVSLTKAGTGFVDLTAAANTFSGPTAINAGILRISSDASLGTAPGVVTAGALKIYNGTLAITGTTTLNANRSIEVGGTGVVSIAAGATGAGKVLTYNGSITSAAGSEGGINILSNPTAVNSEPGKITGTLSALNVGGDFRVDSTTTAGLTISSAYPNATVGRSLRVGTDGPATLIYTGAANSLTVGKGIADTLDVGFVTTDAATSPAFSTSSAGVLNLAGLQQFSANVDQVRIGQGGASQYGYGTVTLAINSDISAGTSFVIADSGNIGQQSAAQQSAVLFGAGTSNVTTKTFTVGGRKSNGKATVAAGGTLNLQGFGQNSLTLNIGANPVSSGTVDVGLLDTSGGTLVASVNRLAIGEKTLGGTGAATGTLTVNGTGNAINANSVVVSNLNGGSGATGAVTNSGALNFGGGTFVVNTDLALATSTANATGGTAAILTNTSTLAISGGTFTVAGNVNASNLSTNTTSLGGAINGMATITVSAGNFTIGGNLNLAALSANTVTAGSVSSTASLTLTGGVTTIGGNLTTGVSSTGQTSTSTLLLNGGTLDLTTTGATDGIIAVKTFTAQAGTLQNVGQIFAQDGVTPAALTKTTTGVLIVGGSNTFTGPTNVTGGTLNVTGSISATSSVAIGGGTTLRLSGSGNMVADSAPMSLTSGTLGFANTVNGVNENLGPLTLGGASTIDFGTGTGGDIFQFDSLTLSSFTGLTILNFTGSNAGNGSNLDKLVFELPTGLTAPQLAQITFYDDANNFLGTAAEIPSGSFVEIVPVPEPSTAALLGSISLFSVIGFGRRRRSIAAL